MNEVLIFCRWKLHLRSKHLEASHFSDADLPPLPSGKVAVEVLGDFMRYLFKCAKEYITEAHASGSFVWDSLESHMEFILTHPNGWEGPQQQQIRSAAELGGLIPAGEEGQSRIHLLTEGEASLHFCVTNVLTSDTFFSAPIACTEEAEEEPEEQHQEHQGVIIIDAGGGTVDLSAYSMKLSPTSFQEIAPAECTCHGMWIYRCSMSWQVVFKGLSSSPIVLKHSYEVWFTHSPSVSD